MIYGIHSFKSLTRKDLRGRGPSSCGAQQILVVRVSGPREGPRLRSVRGRAAGPVAAGGPPTCPRTARPSSPPALGQRGRGAQRLAPAPHAAGTVPPATGRPLPTPPSSSAGPSSRFPFALTLPQWFLGCRGIECKMRRFPPWRCPLPQMAPAGIKSREFNFAAESRVPREGTGGKEDPAGMAVATAAPASLPTGGKEESQGAGRGRWAPPFSRRGRGPAASAGWGR